jgi:hypothetical protein
VRSLAVDARRPVEVPLGAASKSLEITKKRPLVEASPNRDA